MSSSSSNEYVNSRSNSAASNELCAHVSSSSSSHEDKKFELLETLVHDQKHLIQLLNILNNNVVDLMIDIKDMKHGQHQQQQHTSTVLLSPTTPTHTNRTNEHLNGSISETKPNPTLNITTRIDSHDSEPTTAIQTNNLRINYKSSSLRDFSTFVSKMVRQQFGCNYLAVTRINDLDRYTMQRIKDEAVEKYLPKDVSPQFAWNHAMNSLRQLRHRQCKKFKASNIGNSNTV